MNDKQREVIGVALREQANRFLTDTHPAANDTQGHIKEEG